MGSIFNQGSAQRVSDAQTAIYTGLVMVGKVPEEGKVEAEGRNRSLPELQVEKGHPRQKEQHLQRQSAQSI